MHLRHIFSIFIFSLFLYPPNCDASAKSQTRSGHLSAPSDKVVVNKKKPSLFFQSQSKETELVKLSSTGSVPDWISGKLVRNGPGLFEVGKSKVRHWFDGFGMLHGFFIKNGEVYYHSKFIQSPDYVQSMKKGKLQGLSWGTPVELCSSALGRFFATFSTHPSNTNVAVARVGDRYYSTSDMAVINEFDVKSLVTSSTNVFTKTGVMAAHSSFDSEGTAWNMITKYGARANNIFISFDEGFKPKKHSSFGSKKPWYTHSFGGNDNYIVAIEQPMYLSFGKFMSSKIKKRSYYECFSWDSNAKNVLHIYDKNKKKVRHIKLDETFFFFHTINTFEKGGMLYVDLCGSKDNGVINDFYMNTFQYKGGVGEKNRPYFMRIEIDLENNSASVEKRKHVSFELPSINNARRGREYRFAYGIASVFFSEILKYDVVKDTYTVWKEEDVIVGEPIFVATPGSSSEDDGVLLVVCWDKKKEESFLAVLDAKTMKELSRSYVPRHIPVSLHGGFYPGISK